MTRNELIDLVAARYFTAVIDARKSYQNQSMASYALSKGIIVLAEEIAEKDTFWMILGDLRMMIDDKMPDEEPTMDDYRAVMVKHGFKYDSDGKLLNP